MSDARLRWEEHYQQGATPWDTGITPPEVQQFWAGALLPRRGLAIDLGCGPGTNIAFLARQGLYAIGVDHAGLALALSLQRIRRKHPDLLPRIQLVQADVARLPLHNAGAAYILDIGCLHSLPPPLRLDYAAGAIDNLTLGGFYHLFAFDRVQTDNADPEKRWRGMEEDEIATLFAPHLQVVEILRGRPDRQPCRWYLLRKGKPPCPPFW
jgi:SAM-dependent methyltransferase